mgnify:CR=1 FL=1
MFKMKAAIRPNQQANNKLRFKKTSVLRASWIHNKQNSPPNVLIHAMRKLKEKLFALG